MMKWAKIDMLEPWENMQKKILKFTLKYNLKENFYKIMYHGYMTPHKLSKKYKVISNN